MAKDKIIQQEMINRSRADMMYKAIDVVNAMPPKDVADRVRKVSAEDYSCKVGSEDHVSQVSSEDGLSLSQNQETFQAYLISFSSASPAWSSTK